MNLFDLTGKVAIVTGCNTGLGHSIAVGLAEAGADIVGVYLTTNNEKTKNSVMKLGRQFTGVQADVTKAADRQKIIETAISQFGQIDILVNNAGVTRRNDSIDFTEHEWDLVMDVNLKALFFLSQLTARYFFEHHKAGKIINMASMLSFQGGIRAPSYTASKSAVVGITKTMANEWSSKNINVNAVAPGYMLTEMTQPLKDDLERNKEIISRIPAGHWGSSDDIKGAIIFLAASASDYVHGATIAVDGGWLSK